MEDRTIQKKKVRVRDIVQIIFIIIFVLTALICFYVIIDTIISKNETQFKIATIVVSTLLPSILLFVIYYLKKQDQNQNKTEDENKLGKRSSEGNNEQLIDIKTTIGKLENNTNVVLSKILENLYDKKNPPTLDDLMDGITIPSDVVSLMKNVSNTCNNIYELKKLNAVNALLLLYAHTDFGKKVLDKLYNSEKKTDLMDFINSATINDNYRKICLILSFSKVFEKKWKDNYDDIIKQEHITFYPHKEWGTTKIVFNGEVNPQPREHEVDVVLIRMFGSTEGLMKDIFKENRGNVKLYLVHPIIEKTKCYENEEKINNNLPRILSSCKRTSHENEDINKLSRSLRVLKNISDFSNLNDMDEVELNLFKYEYPDFGFQATMINPLMQIFPDVLPFRKPDVRFAIELKSPSIFKTFVNDVNTALKGNGKNLETIIFSKNNKKEKYNELENECIQYYKEFLIKKKLNIDDKAISFLAIKSEWEKEDIKRILSFS